PPGEAAQVATQHGPGHVRVVGGDGLARTGGVGGEPAPDAGRETQTLVALHAGDVDDVAPVGDGDVDGFARCVPQLFEHGEGDHVQAHAVDGDLAQLVHPHAQPVPPTGGALGEAAPGEGGEEAVGRALGH